MSKMSTTIGTKLMTSARNKLFYLWAFVLALAVIMAALTISIDRTSHNIKNYTNFQKEHAIDKATGKSLEELEIIDQNISLFLSFPDEDFLAKDFNSKEISHMKDVYKLYELSNTYMGFSIAVVVLSVFVAVAKRIRHELLVKSLVCILIILAILLIMVLVVSINFDKYFTKFHEIFFDNDLWILNPETDLMIQMMPLSFFQMMAAKIFLGTLAIIGGYSLLVILDRVISKRLIQRKERKEEIKDAI